MFCRERERERNSEKSHTDYAVRFFFVTCSVFSSIFSSVWLLILIKFALATGITCISLRYLINFSLSFWLVNILNIVCYNDKKNCPTRFYGNRLHVKYARSFHHFTIANRSMYWCDQWSATMWISVDFNNDACVIDSNSNFCSQNSNYESFYFWLMWINSCVD